MKFFTATLAPWALVALTSVSAVVAVPNHAKRQSSSASTPVSPLTPSVTDEGSPLLIQWDTTTSQAWKSMEIKFMTGSNQNMTELFTVATGVDGTSSGAGQLRWTAPNVSPNSGIYFFQFTHNGQDPTWTTRFAIADTNGAVTTPPNARQPEGPAIPWGTGRIVSGAVSASGSDSDSSSSSSSTGAIAAASTSASSAAAATSSSSSASQSSSSASSSSSSASNAAQTSNTSSSSSSSSGSSKQSSSASTTVRVGSAAMVGGVVAALAGAMLA
ncbi:Ser-Thr-rich glycosyl-phosphatidyl-inositol-anchored membrane family [Kalmanozyma brasiliensis GHG001]|uniref:Yeast cell wall synthesis Kre9/Knh1-like N-terminal domain-containing protein n=1 Tax=Kalmanozyma brasiliensis (strain GHG001) TaxID=1365824 RepID=V5ENG4_KALBG|nr:Ser-Thr-rich glycosyl-phosphatidyl-inositol-anchored membrane family [Kalmanozyma brasiliensis GHG001]EST06625.1 Ser-Thr-rich glycosyl-phosphatidyl-inositol-anchored membrane family [Kalmanozyma brasiliensis GHG001]